MSSFRTFRLVQVQDKTPKKEDSWTDQSDPKERRKRQNRLNQRALRQRKLQKEISPSDSAPFLPTEWSRLDEQAPTPTSVYFPLTQDHQLLHVVSMNVMRAVMVNYTIICTVPLSTLSFCSVRRVFWLDDASNRDGDARGCGAIPSNIGALSTLLPEALRPTNVQQTVPHMGWIDLLPSPSLRDQVILLSDWGQIDEEEFIRDMLGISMDDLCGSGFREPDTGLELATTSNALATTAVSTFNEPREAEWPRPSGPSGPSGTANTVPQCDGWRGEPGLISWSDPWMITGWEVTDRFAKKWGSILGGCPDVLAATNSWREYRVEDPVNV